MRRTLVFNFFSPFPIMLVVLGFNATLTAMVISWRSVTHMCFLAFSHQYLHNFSFQSHRLLFPHASAEVRGENTPERKVASTGDRTHNHQVMSPTRSPLSHPGGAFPIMFQPTTFIDRLERICAFCVRDLQFSSVNRVSRSTWHVLI